ncbi:hypothetical protein [Nodularia chucula]|uniref:hypothetical protein n=1 Tax=Nodularia chucula TaxID=3093667 RepID=UPI0039C60CEE
MASKPNFKLISISIGLIILLISLLGALSIKNHQRQFLGKKNTIEALLLNTINSIDKDTLEKTHQEVEEYIKQLKFVADVKIPFLSCQECQVQLQYMQPKLETINNNIKGIENLEAAMNLAIKSAILTQNPPHSVDTWEQAKSQYLQSIKLLENINPENVVFDQAQEKLIDYRKNLAYINDVYSLEKKAITTFQDSKKLVEESNNYLNRQPKKRSDLQEAESKLKQAVTLLTNISNGTTVTKIAKEDLIHVHKKYQEVSVKLKNFIDPTEFNNFEIKCNQIGSKFIDLELVNCFGYFATLKNYSNDWYEINYHYNNGRILTERFVLIPPGREKAVSLRRDIQRDIIKVRKLLSPPSKRVKINCNDQLIDIWGIEINPKCTSQGTYLDLSAYNTLKTLIRLDSGNTLRFENIELITQNGRITSTGKTVDFTILIE